MDPERSMERPSHLNGVPVPYDAPVSVLRDAASKPGPAAWASILALGHHGAGEAHDVLLRLAGSPDWRCRRAALEAISFHARSESAHDLFLAALRDESAFVARAACEIVGRLGIASARARVLSLLGSEHAAVRRAAVSAIADLLAVDDFDRVLRVFREDPSPETRREAAWALRKNAGPGTWRRLVETWAEDELPRHRVWACELAGEFGDRSVRRKLEVLTEDPDGHVRKAANRALGRLGGNTTQQE